MLEFILVVMTGRRVLVYTVHICTFISLITTGDGRVSRHEYTTYVTTTTPELHDFAHALYDDYDVTGDHHLDHVDYDQYYAKLDADGRFITRHMFFKFRTTVYHKTVSFVKNGCLLQGLGKSILEGIDFPVPISV